MNNEVDEPEQQKTVEDLEADAEDQPVRVESPPTVDQKMIDLNDGEELSKQSATRITGRRQARVILLAGDADSGKTTLIASVYERFQLGPFANYVFAGSDSFMGFERRCWRSRINSNANSPETDRTPTGAHGLLHLRVRRDGKELGPPEDILLFDISGEDFREARNSTAACERIGELHRADHLSLLVDGAKLIDPSLRHAAIRNSRLLLQRFIDSGMLPANAIVEIIFTKYDLIEPQEKVADVSDFLQNAESSLSTTFKDHVAKLRFFKVASRPRSKKLKLAHGLSAIFPNWVDEMPFRAPSRLPPLHDLPSGREIDRYLKRRLPQLFSGGSK